MSSRKPTSRPWSIASSRAWDSTACSLRASSSIWRSRPSTLTEITAILTMIPMITMTTRISSSVKPETRWRIGSCGLLDIPVADVGIVALAAGLAVGPEGIEVELAARAGTQVHVIVVPGILAQALQVAANLVVGKVGWLLDERLETFVRGRVTEVVHPEQVQRGLVSADVLLGLDDVRVVDALDHVRRHERGEDAEDHDHDHDLDQRKTRLTRLDRRRM